MPEDEALTPSGNADGPEAAAVTAGGEPAALAAQVPCVVLVVDDDTRILEMLRWALEDEGLAVLTALSGRQALAHLQAVRPNLVILDYTLEVLDGPRTAALLREACGESLPILLLSGDGHIARKAAQVGAYAYLRKPFDVADVLARVAEGLNGPASAASSEP